jgi:hypothetical protein
MQQIVVISLDEVRETLSTYGKLLEVEGLDTNAILQYSMYGILDDKGDDFDAMKQMISSDIESSGLTFPGQSLAFNDRLLYTCLDAVGDTMAVLRPQLYNALGILPKSLTYEGKLGDDLLVCLHTDF